MSNRDKVKEIEETYEEAYASWSGWQITAEEDDRMYLNDQWKDGEATKLINEGRPVLSINQIKKPIDLINGVHRQNKMDVITLPVEGTDQSFADIYTEVMKWILTNGGGGYSRSLAFDDATRTGLGWIVPEIVYDDDPLSGDIMINCGNKYTLMPDPYFTDLRLRDCDYILRHKWLSKNKAARLYPEHEKLIKKMYSVASSKFPVQQQHTKITDIESKVHVVEKWAREYEKQIILYDPISQEGKPWDKTRKELEELQAARPEIFERLLIVERKIPRIKLMTSINDKELVYDGDPPSGFSRTKYPFIPVFGYYLPSFNEWKWKLQGVVRVMKDSQRELNKSRSLLMDAQMTNISSGWLYEQGVVTDPSELNKTGAGQKIEVTNIEKIKRLDPPSLHVAMAQLEEMHKGDMRELGPNPDLLGLVGQGGSSAAAPGVSLQLRQKQGLTSLEMLNENRVVANIMLGNYLIDLINRWPKEKIQRIINRQLPENWDQIKKTAKYDCIVDERTSSPTYRMSNFMALQSLVQHGMQIPVEVLREEMDLPAKTKQMWMETEQQNKQQAQKLQQMQIMQKIQAETQGDIQKESVKIKGDKEIEAMEQQGDQRLKQMDISGKMAIEQLKLKRQPKKAWK